MLQNQRGLLAPESWNLASSELFNKFLEEEAREGWNMVDGRRKVRYDSLLACRELAAADAKLGSLIERVGPFSLKLKSSHSPFEALFESILYQQLHGRAAATILARLLVACGGSHPLPEQLLALPVERMRAAGVSQNKILALQDLARKTLDGTVPSLARIRRMPEDEILERLTEVRGVGIWTAEMFLIFRLGRPDVFPVSDYGVRKGFLLTFGKKAAGKPVTIDMLPTADEMLRRSRRWRPWRSVASWYLWRACDMERSDSAGLSIPG
jgi:DNA-3-methyladenine glycosylase II